MDILQLSGRSQATAGSSGAVCNDKHPRLPFNADQVKPFSELAVAQEVTCVANKGRTHDTSDP